MQNDPLQGNANPNGLNNPASLAAANEAGRYNDSEEDLHEKNDNEKEQDTKPEDFEKFNVDKVDDLNEVKKDHNEE